jgi:branched-chain amino acid transport system permease protein
VSLDAQLNSKRSIKSAAISLLIAFAGSFWSFQPAMANEVGTEFDNRISGNVQFEGEPLEGVLIRVSGQGYTNEVTTNSEGKWRIGVPEQGDYEVFLDESTLPDGISVVEEGATQQVNVGKSGRVTKNFFLGESERTTTSTLDQLIARSIYGLNFGLMLALAAIGLSLVFGTTGLSNFAHAEMVTFGAVMALLFSVALEFPIWIAIPLAIIASGIMGYGLDSGLWKPLRKRGLGLVQLMILSIGLSLTARYIFQFFIGGETSQIPGYDAKKMNLFGAVALSVVDIVSMILSTVVILVFAFWLLYTKIGKATRAISDNASLAAASGIDVDRVIRIVWVVAASLAGLAGVLWAYFRPGIKWDMGAQILLLMFAAVTLGGLGTAFGALIGALIVGVLIETSALVIPNDLKYVGALVILIGILLFRPQGILGRKERIG